MPEVIFTDGFDDNEPTRPGDPPITRDEIARFFDQVEQRAQRRDREILLAIETMTSRVLGEIAARDVRHNERSDRDTERIVDLEQRVKNFEDARDVLRNRINGGRAT